MSDDLGKVDGLLSEISQFLDEQLQPTPPQNAIGCEIAPPITPRAMCDPSEDAQCSSDRNKMEIEILGYYHIDCGPPDQELVDRIKTAFYGGSTIEEGPTTHVKRERVCEEFVQSGIEEQIEDIVQKELGHAGIIQGPVIVGHNPRPTQLGPKMAHPVKDGISLFRVVNGSINPGQGVFKIYPTTHHQSSEEFQAHSIAPIQPIMDSTKLFVLRGGIRCEIIPPEGCLMVWIGYSVRPMFYHIRQPGTFPFMTNYEYVELPPLDSQSGRKIHDYKRKS